MKFSEHPDRLNFDFASDAARRDYLGLDEEARKRHEKWLQKQ